MRKEYAVYKGDDLLVMGTARECAAELNVRPETIRWHSTPTGRKRSASRKKQDKCLVVLKLDD
ncbi:hypothetical protein BN1002_04542 [Bacillus sp. B-jedd]|nr:hypothetical protein BN1002_04789 [Bacillus sp. B-jedd]CEG25986.1 hypothetical protein BN1002_00824 [Bacillus sp. B-jedd]CEG29584.1 hypothetical protein BN1002_04542 [Bacillus sp. B-jedd]